jgi:hypothetical protein
LNQRYSDGKNLGSPPKDISCFFVSAMLLEQSTTQLLSLVDKECLHHKHSEHSTQVLLAQSVVVAKIMTSVFQRVESLILNFLERLTSTHYEYYILLCEWNVGNPTEGGLLPVFTNLQALQDIDNHLLVRIVEMDIVYKGGIISLWSIFGIKTR